MPIAGVSLPNLVLELLELLPRRKGAPLDSARRILKEHEAGLSEDRELVKSLIDQWAGLATRKGPNPKHRLASPRLITTPRGDRRQALEKRLLRNADDLEEALPKAISAAIKIALCELELESEYRRDEATETGAIYRGKLKVYAEVAVAADKLHADHGVTYAQWAALRKEDYEAIANILFRRT